DTSGYRMYTVHFPTRRSSELATTSVCTAKLGQLHPIGCTRLRPGHCKALSRRLCCAALFATQGYPLCTDCFASAAACLRLVCTRSEEHTSELQSRENLVCRLL